VPCAAETWIQQQGKASFSSVRLWVLQSRAPHSLWDGGDGGEGHLRLGVGRHEIWTFSVSHHDWWKRRTGAASFIGRILLWVLLSHAPAEGPFDGGERAPPNTC